jgi:hypothetical protein
LFFELHLVRILLFLERLLLLLELLLELGVGFLEVSQVILEEPCLSSPFMLQHLELPLQKAILRNTLGYTLIQGSKFLVTTHNYFQFF